MGTSPKMKKEEVFDFPTAMKYAILGKRVRRIEWPESEFGVLQEGFLCIQRNGFHRWLVSDGDMTATDWKVVE